MNEPQYREPGQDIEVIPVEFDSRGNPRRYEVVKVGQPTQPPAVIEDVAPIVSPMPPAPPRLVTVTEGSHQDRARAFGITTLQLSLVVGVLFIVATIGLRGAIPALFSLALVFFGGFSLTWLAAYVLHTLSSAEGVELYNVFRLWNFLDNEQKERHRRYGQPEKKISTADKVFTLLFTGLLLLYWIAWLLVRNGVIQ